MALFQWAAISNHPELDLLHASANGGHRVKSVAAKLKSSGVKPGVPDIFLPVARHGYFGLFIELKKPKDTTPAGRPTKQQLEWLQQLSSSGYLAVLCVGWEAAKQTITDYLTETEK